MNTPAAALRPPLSLPGRWVLLWLGMIAITVLLMLARDSLPWAFSYPRGWRLPLSGWISDFMKWLINSFDLGLFTFKELTRAVAWLVEQPYTLVRSFLSTATGFGTVGLSNGKPFIEMKMGTLDAQRCINHERGCRRRWIKD